MIKRWAVRVTGKELQLVRHPGYLFARYGYDIRACQNISDLLYTVPTREAPRICRIRRKLTATQVVQCNHREWEFPSNLFPDTQNGYKLWEESRHFRVRADGRGAWSTRCDHVPQKSQVFPGHMVLGMVMEDCFKDHGTSGLWVSLWNHKPPPCYRSHQNRGNDKMIMLKLM